MTAKQLLGLGVRLFAVWLAVRGLAYVAFLSTALADYPEIGSPWLAHAFGAAQVVIAIALWLFPMVVAGALLPPARGGMPLSANTYELARVGSSLLGLAVLAQALPQLILLAFNIVLYHGDQSLIGAMEPQDKMSLFIAVVKALLSGLLIFKSNLFARWVVPEFATVSEGSTNQSRASSETESTRAANAPED